MKDILTAVLVPLSILIPIGIFLFKYKIAGKESKTLFYYLIFAGLVNAAGIYLSNRGIRNLPLLHLYTIGETIFLLTYFLLIFENRAIRKVLFCAIILLPVAFILNFLFFQSIYEFNTYARPVEAILITAVCLIFLYNSGFVEDFLKQPKSWINIGILIYFPTATIIFILSNYFVFVSSNRTLNNIIWDIHSILVLGMYLAFAKGFSLIKKEDDR
ncbi:hypothetical protein [Pedobacter nanyangensis]|uniref:hypothetical protein n=1 Tax=Pedobacter nanyangensis TaxID=1562389 RepID=UPI000DE32489|nr:hypothetical protein [Pedobacter nanyangensis]